MTTQEFAIESRGFAVAADVLDSRAISRLLNTLSDCEHARSERRGETFGIRDLLALEEVRTVSNCLTA